MGSIRCTASYRCQLVRTIHHVDNADKSFTPWQRGIPVATEAINNGTNTGLLAVHILSFRNSDLVRNMEEYPKDLEKEVLGKAGKGWLGELLGESRLSW